MNNPGLAVCLVVVALLSACSSAPTSSNKDLALMDKGSSKTLYLAHSVIFSKGANPPLTEREFHSEVDTNSRLSVTSYRFHNYFNGPDGSTDTVVVVAISGLSAGFGVYDSAGNALVEYSKGKVFGSVVVFKVKTSEGTRNARWYFATKTITSIIDTYDASGDIVYSELTTYTAQ